MQKITLSILKTISQCRAKVLGSTAVAIAIATMILASATAMAQPPTGNLLSDADFSSDTILTPFGSSIESQWKYEAAQIAIGTVEEINPQSPDGMMQLNETSLVSSQVRQSINVSAYANEIDLGMVSAVARAFYNCPTGGCTAALSIRDTATRLQPLPEGVIVISPLNGDPEVWQEANVGLSKPVAIPPGTRSIDIEVAFSNGTIPNGGFVDDAFLGLRFSQCEAQGDGIAGETVQVNYKGLEPNQEILVFLESDQALEGVFADANGEGTIQLPIPSDTPEGTHLITLEHDGSDLTAACTVETLPSLPDTETCDPNAPGVNVIIGTEKFDYLRGTPGDDVIIALGGNDIIIGAGGNDCIDGGEGRDLILAREGDDTIIGGPGNDLIYGNGGADIISGGAGNDTIFGSAGDDKIDGNEGEDKIFGGSGTDACANGILRQCELDIVIIPPQSIVSGRIFEADGSAVPNVSISAFKNGEPFSFPEDDSLIQLDADGSFEIFLATEEEVTLKFVAEGFATQVLPVKAPSLEDGKVDIDVMMIARGEPQTVNAHDGGTITGADGASVTIAGTSFVDQAGNLLVDSENILVTVTPVDISTPAGVASFPSDFSGIPENEATESPIVSLGLVEYDLTLASTGEEVQLAPNQTAEILIPLYTKEKLEGGKYEVGDSIALWSLDELTGIWVQEGMGTVVESNDSPTGLALQATVSHFTWWNCDVTYSPAQAEVTVIADQDGTALIKARTTANIGSRPSTVDTIINLRETSLPLPVPSNAETCFWAEINFIDGSQSITAEECVTPPSSATFPVTLGVSSAPFAITASPLNSGPIRGIKNRHIQIIKLRSLSIETGVTYKITTGSLPNGMNLTLADATGAIIAGIPTEVGDFTVEITGTDSDDITEIIILNYSILQPLIWEDNEFVKTNRLNWVLAKNYCEELELDGRNDWKLPTAAYIPDMINAAPSWSNIPFSNLVSNTSVYWLASDTGFLASRQPDNADIFVFGHDNQTGHIGASVKSNNTLGVRCVIGEPTL